MIRLIFGFLILLSLTACSGERDTIDADGSIEQAMSVQLDALEKANNVQQSLSDAVQKRQQEAQESQ